MATIEALLKEIRLKDDDAKEPANAKNTEVSCEPAVTEPDAEPPHITGAAKKKQKRGKLVLACEQPPAQPPGTAPINEFNVSRPAGNAYPLIAFVRATHPLYDHRETLPSAMCELMQYALLDDEDEESNYATLPTIHSDLAVVWRSKGRQLELLMLGKSTGRLRKKFGRHDGLSSRLNKGTWCTVYYQRFREAPQHVKVLAMERHQQAIPTKVIDGVVCLLVHVRAMKMPSANGSATLHHECRTGSEWVEVRRIEREADGAALRSAVTKGADVVRAEGWCYPGPTAEFFNLARLTTSPVPSSTVISEESLALETRQSHVGVVCMEDDELLYLFCDEFPVEVLIDRTSSTHASLPHIGQWIEFHCRQGAEGCMMEDYKGIASPYRTVPLSDGVMIECLVQISEHSCEVDVTSEVFTDIYDIYSLVQPWMRGWFRGVIGYHYEEGDASRAWVLEHVYC